MYACSREYAPIQQERKSKREIVGQYECEWKNAHITWNFNISCAQTPSLSVPMQKEAIHKYKYHSVCLPKINPLLTYLAIHYQTLTTSSDKIYQRRTKSIQYHHLHFSLHHHHVDDQRRRMKYNLKQYEDNVVECVVWMSFWFGWAASWAWMKNRLPVSYRTANLRLLRWIPN